MKMESNFNVNKAAKSVTMTVKILGIRKFRIKLIIARILIMLACWVIGFGLKFEDGGAA